MKNIISFIFGVLVTMLAVYAYIPNLDSFVSFYETPSPKVITITKTVKPDTVYKVKIDTMIVTRMVNRYFRDTLYTTEYDTIYLERGIETVSERLFTYDYSTFLVRAYSPLPVREFETKATFDYSSYLKDNNYIQKPKSFLWLTLSEWRLLGLGVGVGAVGWEIVR